MLINLWVKDKSNGHIHQVGTDVHDSIEYLCGQVVYTNMQSTASTLDEYEFVEAPDIDDYVAVTPEQLYLNRELVHKDIFDMLEKGGEGGMKVLSLFDGISCGMVALERAGIPVERYVAYEIDEDAIEVSKYNYPQIEHKGDVFAAEYRSGEFDLLIGGSPCTYWSIARGNGEREIQMGGIGWELFCQYARALYEVKPKYFLYENNASMSDEIKNCISTILNCQPLLIDSADFSAQKRKRYYWTNIPVAEWKPSEILFSDIMDKEFEKSRSIAKYKSTYKWSKDGMCISWDTSGKGYFSQASRARLPQQKWNTVCANRAESKGNVWLGDDMIRLVTMSELEKLQTLPVGYTSCLKNKEKRGKGIGNGWTVDVIAHIFKGLTQGGEE